MGISTLLSFIGINLSVAVLDINNVIAHGRFSVFGNFGTHLCLKLFINFRRDKDIGEEWVFKDLKVKAFRSIAYNWKYDEGVSEVQINWNT